MQSKHKRISNRTSEPEWLRPVQQAAESLRHGAIRLANRVAQVVQTEPTEKRLLASVALPIAQRATTESFVTDWADS